jgi:F-type H+-transporting ATPase subunit b
MPSHLLVLATAAAAQSGEAASGVTKLFDDFGIDVPLLLAQILCFSVVAVVLWKFGFKPILATLDERNARIAEGLKNAAATAVALEKARQDSAGLIKQAQAEGARFIDEARKTAKELADRQQKEAAARAEDLIVKARQSMELEQKRLLEEARTEVARLVVATTQRVLSKELSEAERSRYAAAAARELTEIKS